MSEIDLHLPMLNRMAEILIKHGALPANFMEKMMTTAPELQANFLVINGSDGAAAVIVDGIEGVKQRVIELMGETGTPLDKMPNDVQRMLATIDNPEDWDDHGAGDHKPFYELHFSFEDGFLRVQRITENKTNLDLAGGLRAQLAHVNREKDEAFMQIANQRRDFDRSRDLLRQNIIDLNLQLEQNLCVTFRRFWKRQLSRFTS